ncbi:MAG: hypothetical protein ACI8U4_001527, partial [Natronomonas sp.]
TEGFGEYYGPVSASIAHEHAAKPHGIT